MTTWIERRTSDLIDGLRAGVSVRSVSSEAGGPAVLKTSAIKAGRFDPRESKPILPADLPRAKCPVVADSIIISRMNTPALVGDVGYVEKDVDSLFLPDRLWIARSKRGSGTDIRWLTYHFSSQAGARALRELATGTSGSMKNIPKDKVLGLKVLTPTPPEQRAIADALTDAENLISSLKRLISKKKAIKQGMMQELLRGKTRLPGFQESWVQTKIGKLACVFGGGTPSTKTPSYWNGDIPWFTPGEISKNGSGLVKSSERSITSEGLQRSGAKLLPASSILVTSRASLGHCAVAEVPVATNQGFTSLVPKDSRSSWFLYYWMQHNRHELQTRAAGSTFLEISSSKVESIPITIPSIREQEAVAEVLRDADNEIDALDRRLESARGIKQGMMQELLTGRTRLVLEGVR